MTLSVSAFFSEGFEQPYVASKVSRGGRGLNECAALCLVQPVPQGLASRH